MKSPRTFFVVILVAILSGMASAEASLIVFQIGSDDNSSSELEQEGGARNDRNYYWENGDYTTTFGLNGAGNNHTTGMEIFQDPRTPHNDGGDGTIGGAHTASQHASADDAQTTDGFPRALTTSTNTNNIFFQLSSEEVEPNRRLVFEIDVRTGKAGTTHDLEFLFDGNIFHTETGRDVTPGLITAVIDPNLFGGGVSAGEHVISMRRTGGVTTSGSAWIVWDYTSLTAVVPEPSSAFSLIFLIGALAGKHRRRRSISAAS